MAFKEKLLIWLAEYPGSWFLRALGATLRMRIFGTRYLHERRKGATKRVVYAFWHCHILPLVLAYKGEGGRVMISEHRDGELIARVVERFGFTTERGSTTRGGAKALRALIRLKRDPSMCDLALTPDGPRGPARRAQSGSVYLASKTGFPLVPIGVALDRPRKLNSWDRFQIPRFFSRCAIVVGEEIPVDGTLTDDQAEATCRLLEERLARAEKEAFEKLENWNG